MWYPSHYSSAYGPSKCSSSSEGIKVLPSNHDWQKVRGAAAAFVPENLSLLQLWEIQVAAAETSLRPPAVPLVIENKETVWQAYKPGSSHMPHTPTTVVVTQVPSVSDTWGHTPPKSSRQKIP